MKKGIVFCIKGIDLIYSTFLRDSIIFIFFKSLISTSVQIMIYKLNKIFTKDEIIYIKNTNYNSIF